MTKEELAEYQKKYREEHREQINANKRYWYKRNRDKVREYQREYHKKRKDEPEYKAKRKESVKRYRENNRDKFNASCRERYHRKKLEERNEQ